MDQRKTFGSLQDLMAILQPLFQQREMASFLVDAEGITRIEGIITAVEEQKEPGETVITLKHGDKFLLKQIIAVNGLFRADYAEC